MIAGRAGIKTVGVQTTAPQIVDNLLIEDCKLEFLGQGLVLEGPYSHSVRNVRLRRNIIADTYVTNGDTNGVYVSNVLTLVMEENLIDGVQRAPGLPPELVNSSLSHTVYVPSTPREITLRNNIFTRAFDGGMMRPGGLYEGNLVQDVTIGSHHGYMFSASAPINTSGVDANVSRNAFLGVGGNQGIQAGNLRSGRFSDPATAPGGESSHATLGGAATLAAFLAEARQQSRQNWRDPYMARPVIDYLHRQRDCAFTDSPLTGVAIRAAHIAELRACIKAARAVHGLAAFAGTNQTLTRAAPRSARSMCRSSERP